MFGFPYRGPAVGEEGFGEASEENDHSGDDVLYNILQHGRRSDDDGGRLRVYVGCDQTVCRSKIGQRFRDAYLDNSIMAGPNHKVGKGANERANQSN